MNHTFSLFYFWLDKILLDHIDVIITYGATCLTKKVAKSVKFAVFFKQQVLPKMHQ